MSNWYDASRYAECFSSGEYIMDGDVSEGFKVRVIQEIDFTSRIDVLEPDGDNGHYYYSMDPAAASPLLIDMIDST